MKNRNITFFETPYKHWVIDNFLLKDDANTLADLFPKPTPDWYTYDNVFEKKRAQDQIYKMPSAHALTLLIHNAWPWLKELEEITGIKGLIGDPAFRGGGLHNIEPGGKLDVHADFNYHKDLKLHRRLNMLLYLNKKWDPSWGGQLELWDKEMTECVKKIEPILNRCVIFETTSWSFHGHPEPVGCPAGLSRKSMAWYYYTADRPESELQAPHSTKFQRRPQDPIDPQTERLRERRNEGRL